MKKLILIIGLVSLASLASASTPAERREPVNRMKAFGETQEQRDWWDNYKKNVIPKTKKRDYDKNISDFGVCKLEKIYAYISSTSEIRKTFDWYKCEELQK